MVGFFLTIFPLIFSCQMSKCPKYLVLHVGAQRERHRNLWILNHIDLFCQATLNKWGQDPFGCVIHNMSCAVWILLLLLMESLFRTCRILRVASRDASCVDGPERIKDKWCWYQNNENPHGVRRPAGSQSTWNTFQQQLRLRICLCRKSNRVRSIRQHYNILRAISDNLNVWMIVWVNGAKHVCWTFHVRNRILLFGLVLTFTLRNKSF